MVFKKKYFLLSFLFYIIGLKAQVSQSVIIDKINTGKLTNPFVSALLLDQKGYLWVGTNGGLNKYNGYDFTRYWYHPTDSTSLSNPEITCFHQTHPDSIFIGTKKGLNIYDYATNQFRQVYFPGKNKKTSLQNNIHSIISNKRGERIIGTGDGIYKYVGKESSLKPVLFNGTHLLEGWCIQSLCIDRLGNLWCGAKRNDTSAIYSKIFKYDFSEASLSDITIRSNSQHKGISEDYLGNIWVAVDDGLVSIRPSNNKFKFYKAPEKFSANASYTHTRDNVIWQGYWGYGITSFDIDKKRYMIYRNDPGNHNSLMSNKCAALLKDDNEILWIGSNIGLQKISGERAGVEVIKKSHLNKKQPTKGNIITSLLASRKQNNLVFVGTDGEGFTIYNRLTKQANNYGPNAENNNSEEIVNQFLEDKGGDVYVLGQKYFQKVSFSEGSPSIKTYLTSQEHVCACGIQDPTDPNKLWIGGNSEIFSFDKQTQQFHFYSDTLGIKNVFTSAFVVNKNIYFGHSGGLLQIDPISGAFKKINLAHADQIRSALVLNENEVLLTSQFLGLLKFFPQTNKYQIIYNDKGEYFPEPSSLLFYKNTVWLSGNSGLTGLNQKTGEVSQVSAEDGLPAGMIHKTDLLDGYFYLASLEGVAIFNPDFQVSHFIAPKIDVTQIKILTDNSSFSNLKSGAEITLSEEQNSFRINFTVLDFNSPEKNRFKFKLLPVQSEWQKPIGENFLIFNSLSPGEYRFELLGANADQIWSTEPFIIKIKIVPPFYKSNWFYFILVSLIIVISVTLIYIRIRSDNKKKIMLERIIRMRTAEIQIQRAELLDSISYAQRIQKAILVGEDILKDSLKDSFIYYKPKSKLSGDFYWIGKYKDLLIVFAGDCTGHGVPGAMLSVVATSILNKIVHEENIYLPGEILTRLNYLFYNQLSLGVDNLRDGIDASVLTINVVNNAVYYSGARLDALCVVNGQPLELKAKRQSIGDAENLEFTTQNIPFEENRYIYLFSDGLKDQHGGSEKKKLTMKKFKAILVEAASLPISQQKQFVYEVISEWKGDLPQTDDMILTGLKI